MENFGERLKYLRETVKGETQQRLADLIGNKRQSIANWETGKNEASYKDLIKLADHFGASIDWLMKGGELVLEDKVVAIQPKKEGLVAEGLEEIRATYEKMIERLETLLAKSEAREAWYQEQLGKPLAA